MAEPSDWHQSETYKSLITVAVETLKILALINGGAAVAVLTYIGNAKGGGSFSVSLGAVRWALLCFCFGIAATASAFVATYLTQATLYLQERDKRDEEVFPKDHLTYQRAAVGLAITAVLAFMAGCCIAAWALTNPA